MNCIELTNKTIEDVLKQYFPYCVDAPNTISLTIGYRKMLPEIEERFGILATEWQSIGGDDRGTINLDAKWDYWYGYRFKDPNDAVWFKLRYG